MSKDATEYRCEICGHTLVEIEGEEEGLLFCIDSECPEYAGEPGEETE